jgi:hypothetical protein
LIGGSPSNGSIIENKTHIQGKFFSLNTPFEETTKRQTQIASLLKTSNYEEFINLQKLFTRQCGLDGVGSDGITSCTNGNDIGRVSLVILDRAFPSRLLK